MDHLNILQLIISDGVLSFELLAFFAIGFYLLASIMAFPKRAINLPNYSKLLKVGPDLQIGFNFATIVGVGAVLSPPRIWLRQDTTNRG